MFSPSIFGFYTHDDFYHLKISNAQSLKDFFNFFNLKQGIDGQLLYRPLTTHVFYFIGRLFFNLNPIGLHLFSFLLFFVIVIFIYKITYELSQDTEISLITTFLYATSASHFGHLYYLATENVLGVVFFPAVYFFIRYLKDKKYKNYLATFLFLAMSILAKENSVILPAVFILVYAFIKSIDIKRFDFKWLIQISIPFVLLVLVYLYFHFFYYGFVSGDTYNWNFSLSRTINTVFWYALWSFNIPEMFLDFIGPKLHTNPNLFKFWGNHSAPIIGLFAIQVILASFYLLKFVKSKKNAFKKIFFSLSWFIICLSPILFFPEHKFSFYLTLPLFGIVYLTSCLLAKQKAKYIFLILWVITSVFTLDLSYKTNWITQGQKITFKVYKYFELNEKSFNGKKIYFVDTENDNTLPWSPTEVVSTALSKRNFFAVFFPNIANNVYYADDFAEPDSKDSVYIKSRDFLGY